MTRNLHFRKVKASGTVGTIIHVHVILKIGTLATALVISIKWSKLSSLTILSIYFDILFISLCTKELIYFHLDTNMKNSLTYTNRSESSVLKGRNFCILLKDSKCLVKKKTTGKKF